MTGWRVAVDRGGTFADVVALDPEGRVHVRKLLARGAPEADALAAVLPPGAVLDELRVGTTVATNALLTGEGAPAAILLNRGFGDLLRIGHQARPELFALHPRRQPPLVPRAVEVDGRIRADGSVEEELDEEGLARAFAELRSDGIESLAVALLHAWINPAHERRIGALAGAAGFAHVALSSDLAPQPGLLERAWTAEVDASLTPILRAWLRTVDAACPPGARLLAMQSSGGLCAAGDLRGAQALLSGPAGGVIAIAHAAQELGLGAVLGFDMGGTSTDVSRWDGDVERVDRVEVNGRSLRAPSLDVVTVAAGGGSLLSCVDGRFGVGPGSAGADPGPAGYGRGGPAAVTDANLVLGRIQPDFAPSAFGPDARQPLDGDASRAAVDAVAAGGAERGAAGFVAVANAAMAAAIAELSTARGHDPSDHALMAFGGAAGQHACGVARRLGIGRVAFHPLAGVLSALGIARAPRVASRSVAVEEPWSEGLAGSLDARAAPLLDACRQELRRAGAEPSEERLRWALRYRGSDTVLEAVDRAGFEDEHRLRFGFARPEVPVEAAELRVEVRSAEAPLRPLPPIPDAAPGPPAAVRRVGFVSLDGDLAWHDAPIHRRDALPPGAVVRGPALIVSETTTVVLDPGWVGRLDAGGTLLATADGAAAARRLSAERDPVRLELYHRRFMSLATRMGEALRRVAWSVNIKERLDFSCALFDAGGRLIANAPHIPVHLGAMGETVRGLLARRGGALRPGQAWATNDPAQGGSHLPDVTVITPVFHRGERIGFVANRGHHADLGGSTPGSMPPASRSLAEEGVVLRDLLLVDGGVWRDEEIRRALRDGGGAWPARQPDVNVADLQAQAAANALGARLLEAIAAADGADVLAAWMAHVQDHGADAVQAWLEGWPPGGRSFADAMDDGTAVAVSLRREGPSGERRLVVDFGGTGPRSPGNLNAPPAVARAAVLYVLRCALGRSVPLNEGCLRAVDLRLPAGSLLDPGPDSAVVGGNVETSQRLVDVLLGALGLVAASQGTMNNLTVGTARGAWYETVAGGAGAGPGEPGAHAVQSHMTNTRITDAEILELRQPVQVRRFSLRPGSGGAGAARGGDGAVRVLRFTADADVALLSQRRSRRPFGLAGGGPGAAGSAALRTPAGEEALPGCFARRVAAGDELELRTPGGGGFGDADLADM